MPVFPRFVALMCAASLVLFSLPAVACDPSSGTNCRGLTCAAQELGTTKLDGDGKHIIACLKSDYKDASGNEYYMWKTTSSEMGQDTWVQVSLADTNDFDINCQYRIYFDHGGMFPSGYLTAFSVHTDKLLTPVSSYQFVLGKVKSTAKGWWYYTHSGDCSVDFCFWAANKFKNYPDDTNPKFNCADSLIAVKAIMKRCASAYYFPPL